NRRNGDVEAVFIGNAETVATMVEACREGPPAARVTAVEVLRSGLANELGPLAGELFSVLPTL
ncbi:MAG: acylphosphatase, partial [Rhizobiales bacterium]|nr:acylphosphatase [Hyphomicrobiales bacterium]